MKNEVEIIVFMIDAFKINIYEIKIKTKSFDKLNIEKTKVIITQLISGCL